MSRPTKEQMKEFIDGQGYELISNFTATGAYELLKNCKYVLVKIFDESKRTIIGFSTLTEAYKFVKEEDNE